MREDSEAILITGGAGFVGSNFIREWFAHGQGTIINLDALTYAGNPETLADLQTDPRYHFYEGDINDRALLEHILQRHTPRAVVHFAAESHVDRAINDPSRFIHTNVNGTFSLLEACRHYWGKLAAPAQKNFRFLHVSTDEVYGSLSREAPPFTEAHPYQPNNPYAASKAASDHLARAWFATYGLPVLIAHASNNYGPYQFPEKLVPLMITHALAGKPLPLYGDGTQLRDWLYVTDHCAALRCILSQGTPGETYNIGGNAEIENQALVRLLCTLLDRLAPARNMPHPTTGRPLVSYAELITHVADRPGHDQRYATDIHKITHTLGWKPRETCASGMEKTVRWYLDNRAWVEHIQSGAYHAARKKQSA